MSEIFFSYSSKDRDRVRPFFDAMTALGFDVFWDMEVPAGVEWEPWIKTKLAQAKCVVVFWSASATASRKVRYEVEVAEGDNKLVEVLLEPMATRDMRMGSFAVQAVRLMGWSGDRQDGEWQKLLATIEPKLTPPWLRRRIEELTLSLAAERSRLREADDKARTFAAAHDREVEAQGDLRRERSKLVDEKEALIREVEQARKDVGRLQQNLAAQADVRRESSANAAEKEALIREVEQARKDVGRLQQNLAERGTIIDRLRAEQISSAASLELAKRDVGRLQQNFEERSNAAELLRTQLAETQTQFDQHKAMTSAATKVPEPSNTARKRRSERLCGWAILLAIFTYLPRLLLPGVLPSNTLVRENLHLFEIGVACVTVWLLLRAFLNFLPKKESADIFAFAIGIGLAIGLPLYFAWMPSTTLTWSISAAVFQLFCAGVAFAENKK